MIERWRPREQSGKVRVYAVGAKSFPDEKTKVIDSFMSRHVADKCPEIQAGDVGIDIVECQYRQFRLLQPFFNGRAKLRKELCKWTNDGDSV